MSVLILLLFTIMLLCGRYSLVCGNMLSTKDIEKARKFIAYFLLIFITSFRYDVGWDYHTYYRFFASPGGSRNFEPADRAIYYIAQYFNAPWMVFAIFFILTMVFIMLGIRSDSLNKYESLIIFMSLFYIQTLTIIRQFLAIAIIFYALKYVRNKKIVFFLAWVFIASLVHTSAWFAIPIYFIYNYVQLKGTIIFTFITIFFFDRIAEVLFSIDIFQQYNTYYIHILNGGGGNFAKYFYVLLAFGCIVIYIFKRKSFDEDVARILSVFIFGVVYPFILESSTGLRITYYYAIYLIILIPKLLDKLCIKRGRWAMMIPFYAYYVLTLIVDYMNNKGLSPFIFYWNR